MSYRDDFNSSMSSPGSYSSNSAFGNPGYSGNYGGTNNPGSGFTTISQANLAANNGGQFPASGFPSQGLQSLLGNMFGPTSFGPPPSAVQTAPIPPALGPQGVPTSYLKPPVASPAIPPNYSALVNRMNLYRNPFAAQAYARRQNPGNQPGTTPQGSYTRPPGASFGMGMSGYGGMGNDFRSNNFSPSSYPGGDGITGADIGGGGWR